MHQKPSIEDRFPTAATSPAPTNEQKTQSSDIRSAITDTARRIETAVPDGRWKSLALTSLEEALMWANKGLFNSHGHGDR